MQTALYPAVTNLDALGYPPLSSVWKSFSECAKLIEERGESRSWPVQEILGSCPEDTVPDHRGFFLPTGLSIHFGGDFTYNLLEVLLWLKASVESTDLRFDASVLPQKVHLDPRTKFTLGNPMMKPRMTAEPLDLYRFWKPRNLNDEPPDLFPSFEPLILLALNPDVLGDIPNFLIPGLVVASKVTNRLGMLKVSLEGDVVRLRSLEPHDDLEDSTIVTFQQLPNP